MGQLKQELTTPTQGSNHKIGMGCSFTYLPQNFTNNLAFVEKVQKLQPI